MQMHVIAEVEFPSTTASSRWRIIVTAVQSTQLRVSQVSVLSRTLILRCQISGTRHRCTMLPKDAPQLALYTSCNEVLSSSPRTYTGTHHWPLHCNVSTSTTASFWFRRMQTWRLQSTRNIPIASPKCGRMRRKKLSKRLKQLLQMVMLIWMMTVITTAIRKSTETCSTLEELITSWTTFSSTQVSLTLTTTAMRKTKVSLRTMVVKWNKI